MEQAESWTWQKDQERMPAGKNIKKNNNKL